LPICLSWWRRSTARKLAQGQDGKGELPRDFWPTYSAMTNLHGGLLLLGVRETRGVFSVAGLENPARVRADLFNTLNNRARVSVNLLTDADVQEARIEGKSLLVVGGWRDDRVTGESGLTAAGLLMFGQWQAITDAFPLYFLDYQEKPADAESETRWLDRIVPDGSWSGNLFDFFRRVIRKLTADLKVPFVLKGGTRIDDTPVHQALREALVNTLIHCLSSCSSSTTSWTRI
jgi:predicted HTH transcriptional regulator